jgi:hypothetical protein
MGETPIALSVSPWEKTALAPLKKAGLFHSPKSADLQAFQAKKSGD